MSKFHITAASSRALVLFDAAAKTGSFSRAAEFASVGQSAVSHSIRQLENALDVKLFRRLHRGVELTAAGEILAHRVSTGLQEIRAGIVDVQNFTHSSQRITLLVSTALASFWLMPRLARFKSAHPDIELRCITQDTDREVAMSEFDLCIALGANNWSKMQRWLFCEEELFPVCSSAYICNHPPITDLTDLTKHELLHLEERYHSRYDWKKWFIHFKIGNLQPPDGWTSNDYSIVIQSAIEGQGIALGWRHIVQPLVDQGVLCRPIKHSVKSQNPFYIISPDYKIMTPSTEILRDWLIAEIKHG